MKKQKLSGFEQFASKFGDLFGSPTNFVLSLTVVVIWAVVLGPIFNWSNTWQLMINTPTTIVELFAAITIQYVGNRIQRQQEANEEKMLRMLEHLEALNGGSKPGSKMPPANF